MLGLGINRSSSQEPSVVARGGSSYLLDDYSGAAAAYSLRQLSSSYSGDAIKVRRSSDNVEADIRFVNGELDTTGLANHCGSSDGFVSVWYDQSSNTNDATQTTAGYQPKIYDSTTGVLTENGKPAVEFIRSTGVQQLGYTDSFAGTKEDFSIYAVTTTRITDTKQWIWGEATIFAMTPIGGFRINSGTNNIAMTAAVVNSQELRAANIVESTAAYVVSVNGSASSGTGTWTTISRNTAANIGARSNNTWIFDGFMQEIVIYQSDQSTNRTGIEDNINTFYSIY